MTDKKIIKIKRMFRFCEKSPERNGEQAMPKAVGAPTYPLILPITLGSKNKFGK